MTRDKYYKRTFLCSGFTVDLIPVISAADVAPGKERYVTITDLKDATPGGATPDGVRLIASLKLKYVGMSLAHWIDDDKNKTDADLIRAAAAAPEPTRLQEIKTYGGTMTPLLDSASAIHAAINAALKAFHDDTGMKITKITLSPIDGLTVHSVTVDMQHGNAELSARTGPVA